MKITVNKVEITAVIKQNRAEHRKIFLEAVEGYRTKAIELLEKHLAEVKDGKFFSYVSLTLPVDHTRDYDRVLKMLGHHQGETLSLLEEDYAAYVQDDWQWKREFLTSNSRYSGTADKALKAMSIAEKEGA